MKKFLNANNEVLITISEILTINAYEIGTDKNPNYGLRFEFLNLEILIDVSSANANLKRLI